MAIATLDQKKRQKTLLFIALGVILVAVLVLYFGFWKSSPVSVEVVQGPTANPTQTGNTGVSEQKLNEINLDFDFLNNKILPFLKTHGKIPVQVDKDKIGRDNPFIPY